MGLRGLGRVFRPTYKDKSSGELRQSTIWWIEFSDHGHVHRESSKSRRESDAKKLLKTRLGEAGIGKLLPSEVANTSFDDLKTLIKNDYTANDRDTGQLDIVLNRLAESFGGMKAVEINAVRIGAYQAEQKRAGYANATINRDMAALKRAFRLGVRNGVVQHVPHIGMLEENNTRTGFFEPGEFQSFLSHLPEVLRPLFRVAYITGWRVRSELLTREWKHVDFVNQKLRIEPGEDKNRQGREFPFTPELKTILKGQLKRAKAIEKTGEAVVTVFFWEDGSTIKSYRKAWKATVEASGIERIPHDFRRTAVRNLEIAGVPRSAAMAMVGHKTQSIYQRYAIVDESMLQEGARKLAALHKTQGLKTSGRAAKRSGD